MKNKNKQKIQYLLDRDCKFSFYIVDELVEILLK